LWGGAGDADDRAVIALLDNVKTFKQMPSARQLSEIAADICGILALPSGDAYSVDIEKHEAATAWSAQLFPVGRYGYIACGSGRDFALGAMASGKTALEAVNIACKFDIHSRPPVHQLVIRTVAKGTKVGK